MRLGGGMEELTARVVRSYKYTDTLRERVLVVKKLLTCGQVKVNPRLVVSRETTKKAERLPPDRFFRLSPSRLEKFNYG